MEQFEIEYEQTDGKIDFMIISGNDIIDAIIEFEKAQKQSGNKIAYNKHAVVSIHRYP